MERKCTFEDDTEVVLTVRNFMLNRDTDVVTCETAYYVVAESGESSMMVDW